MHALEDSQRHDQSLEVWQVKGAGCENLATKVVYRKCQSCNP
jgi:hypothetical protein